MESLQCGWMEMIVMTVRHIDIVNTPILCRLHIRLRIGPPLGAEAGAVPPRIRKNGSPGRLDKNARVSDERDPHVEVLSFASSFKLCEDYSRDLVPLHHLPRSTSYGNVWSDLLVVLGWIGSSSTSRRKANHRNSSHQQGLSTQDIVLPCRPSLCEGGPSPSLSLRSLDHRMCGAFVDRTGALLPAYGIGAPYRGEGTRRRAEC